MKELSINYQEMEWGEAIGYPAGTQIKMLREHGESQTFLLKLPARFDLEGHAHIATEQHFVLDGEYESDGKKYGRGSYRLIPARTNHGPFISKFGATILVIWELCKE
ncbi:cupin domain-containing protein [candidate division KSB1 bacterium]|nr:cupin domain-containing protein [candidate division KSB1 bacterium]MBL7094373.1 cupin domain-containing protein [candidate division KSB1 bacterium]